MKFFEVHPLTADRWKDFERLFGPRGACAGCWCMFWKLPRNEFETGKYDANRKAQKKIVESGQVPGLIAYHNGYSVGWCAVEPRSHYSRLANSRILAPLDDTPVWSVTCFFVEKSYRRQGVTVALLRAAVEYVDTQGGEVVEGYPTEPGEGAQATPAFVYTGLASALLEAGFHESGRRSPTRPIMRHFIQG